MTAQPRPNSRFVEANGLRLHLLEHGRERPPVVIVPGITSPAATWEWVAAELAKDYRVFTLDNRGRGLSDRPAAGYTLGDYTADLIGAIDALGLEEPTILGHSMGARIAAAVGARYPHRDLPLIVVDPPLSGPGRAPYPFPLPPYLEALRAAQAGATAGEMRPYFPTWTEGQLRTRAEWLGTCAEAAVVESYQHFHDEDFFDDWRLVRPPVLFLYGEDSPVVPAGLLTEVASTCPSAQIVGIPRAGHMIPWDNLPDFLAETRRFLADL